MTLLELLEIAQSLENKEAERLGEHDGWKIEGEATLLYEGIFNAIESNEGTPINAWRHRDRHQYSADQRHLRIHRELLKNYAREYLDKSWLRCKEMDWCLVNILIYAEVQAFLTFLGENKKTRWMLPDDLLGIPNKITTRVALQCVAWLIVILLAFVLFFPIGPIFLMIAYAFNGYSKSKMKKKIIEVLGLMLSTYGSASSINQSWLNLWDDLKRSKDAGAVWDEAVYSIVELKLTKT